MKKKLLFFAVAAAVAIGCTNELLDTSYEDLKNGAQLNGKNPVVFGTYVGNGLTQTRAMINDVADLQTATEGFGVFAYYTGTRKYPDDFVGSDKGIFDYSNNNYSTTFIGSSSNPYFYSFLTSDHPTNFQPNFMYNQQVKYSSTESEWTYSPVKYWPENYESSTASNNAYVSFFAYYPYQESNFTSSADQILRFSRLEQTGDPVLYYNPFFKSSGDVDSYQIDDHIDLMVAEPVLNKAFDKSKAWDATDNTVKFNFKHILSAVSVKLRIVNNGPTNSDVFIHFDKAILTGYSNDNPFSSSSVYDVLRKSGRFNMATGMWDTQGSDALNFMDYLKYGWSSGSFSIDMSGKEQVLYSFKEVSSSFTSTFNSSSFDENDHYMMIIPNYNMQSLGALIEYTVTVPDSKELGGQVVTKQKVQKVVELNFEPGKYYQILLTLDLNAVKLDADVASGWEAVSVVNIP